MIHLRQYQQDALTAERKHRAEHPEENRLAIVLPTGTGKGTILAARAVQHIEDPMSAGQRVLILTHTDELVADLAARARLFAEQSEFPISVGIVKAEQDEVTADVIVASPQTLLQPGRRERIQGVGLVIVDECELYAAPQWRGILQHFGCFAAPCDHAGVSMSLDSLGGHCFDCMDTGLEYGGTRATPALGFTATLERGDGLGLGTLWHDVVFSRDISWAVRKGFLVQPVGYRLEIDLGTHGGGGPRVFTENAIQQDIMLTDGLAPEKIVEKWIELAKDRQTVAFMPLVRSARALTDAFDRAGIEARTIHGDMPEHQRRAALRAYAAGHIQVLVNAMVLTRGWDSPITKCVIVGRPTKSRSLFIQMAGRGLRPVPGTPVEEQDCVLITVADAATDLCSVADLSDRPIDRKAQGALTAMEDQWDIGAALEDPQHLWTGRVDAAQFDPIVARSSKVWRTTRHGTPYLPISKDREYVFIVGTSVFVYETRRPAQIGVSTQMATRRLHKDLPDLELAMQVAEDEAQDRGGNLGALLADRNRPWRKQRPSEEMIDLARKLGLGAEVDRILASRAAGKAGKVSDLINNVLATRALEPMVEKIKERTS